MQMNSNRYNVTTVSTRFDSSNAFKFISKGHQILTKPNMIKKPIHIRVIQMFFTNDT